MQPPNLYVHRLPHLTSLRPILVLHFETITTRSRDLHLGQQAPSSRFLLQQRNTPRTLHHLTFHEFNPSTTITDISTPDDPGRAVCLTTKSPLPRSLVRCTPLRCFIGRKQPATATRRHHRAVNPSSLSRKSSSIPSSCPASSVAQFVKSLTHWWLRQCRFSPGPRHVRGSGRAPALTCWGWSPRSLIQTGLRDAGRTAYKTSVVSTASVRHSTARTIPVRAHHPELERAQALRE